jgi:hypothetical protein
MTSTPIPAWRASAAYLYVLQLDASSLAWEYLRRNPDYQRLWRTPERNGEAAAPWGLSLMEDPELDARAADPLWRCAPAVVIELAARENDACGDGQRFSLWALPGRRALAHDGRRLVVSLAHGTRRMRIALAPDIEDGQASAYLVAADRYLRQRLRTVAEQAAWLLGPRRASTLPTLRCPDRRALAHMRSLQALDGRSAGASQRAVASALFGAGRVADNWDADSEVRAQTRHLIRRGGALMRGGYRDLLLPARPTRRETKRLPPNLPSRNDAVR